MQVTRIQSSPLTAFFLSPVLVGLTTWLLVRLQGWVSIWEGGTRHPSYVSGFYLTIVLISLLGGRGPGLLTVALSLLATDYFLLIPHRQMVVTHPSDFVTLLLLVVNGVLIVFGMEAVRKNARLLAESEVARGQLREREARFRSLVLNSTDVITVLDPEGRILYKSPSEEHILGYPAESHHGETIFSLIHPDDIPRVTAFFQHVVATPGVHPAIEFRFRHRNGEWRYLESISSNQIADRAVAGVIVNSRDITERKRAEAEIQALLTQEQARAEREALINRIGQVIRRSSDPEEIQQAVVTELGQALAADRCYFVFYEPERDTARIGSDWYGEGLPSFAGKYSLSGYDPAFAEYLEAQQTLAVEDVRTGPFSAATAEMLERTRLRSMIRVPLQDGKRQSASMHIVMADRPRAWTADDVILAEAVAAQTRAAIDAAWARIREHNIANSLQDALVPAPPEGLPGLRLAAHYRPALDEAKIGGDFYDVFPLGNDAYALVVGDLSGKGLMAAAQVATVRNMLRYALYRSATQGWPPAQAVTDLNRIVTEYELLRGFVTLFVGVYEPNGPTLTYVSCGHEPGLLRRSHSGEVLELTATGPVLGADTAAFYSQSRVHLEPGDTLALYTDGVSEAGRNRRDLWGVPALAALFATVTTPSPADSVSALIAGMEEHAHGDLHDDVCLLVATVS